MAVYEYDLTNKKVVSECSLRPTEVFKDGESPTFWLYARNNKYEETTVNPSKVGKWMLFPPKHTADELWEKIKQSVQEGHLWHCKISTSLHGDPNPNAKHAVMVYTRDYENLEDVISVLDYLESSGLKVADTIRYKADYQTYAGVYSKDKVKASLYSSNNVRNKLREDKKQTKITSFFGKSKLKERDDDNDDK